MTYLIILIIIVVIILAILALRLLANHKAKSLVKELEGKESFKQFIELYNLQKKFMGEQGTDLDMMPEGIGEFGLEITNPIPTSTVYGSNAYLGRLTHDGIKVGYDRIGSMSAENIPNIIDGYTITKNGNEIATLYLCPYNKKTSEKAPKGFQLIK